MVVLVCASINDTLYSQNKDRIIRFLYMESREYLLNVHRGPVVTLSPSYDLASRPTPFPLSPQLDRSRTRKRNNLLKEKRGGGGGGGAKSYVGEKACMELSIKH
jgi:hypothetical protein